MPSFATLVALTLAVWCTGEVAAGSGRMPPTLVRWLQVFATAAIAWSFGGTGVEQSVLCLALFGGVALVERACSVMDVLASRAAGIDAPRVAGLEAKAAEATPAARAARRSAGIVQHVATVSAIAIEASHRAQQLSNRVGFADREVPRPPSVTPLADQVRAPDTLIEPRRHTPARPALDGTIWQ
jgi:hypothetical protein